MKQHKPPPLFYKDIKKREKKKNKQTNKLAI